MFGCSESCHEINEFLFFPSWCDVARMHAVHAEVFVVGSWKAGFMVVLYVDTFFLFTEGEARSQDMFYFFCMQR